MMTKKAKISLIVAAIIVLASIVYFLGKGKREEKKAQAKLKAQAEKDKADPTKSTYVNEEGVTVTKEEDENTDSLNDKLRKDPQYSQVYKSAKISKAASTIKNAWGFFVDDEDGVYESLNAMSNRMELLALRDFLNNEYGIFSMENYLKKFMNDRELLKANTIIAEVNKKQPSE